MTITQVIQAISEGSLCWLVLGGAFALLFAVAGTCEARSRVNEVLNNADRGNRNEIRGRS